MHQHAFKEKIVVIVAKLKKDIIRGLLLFTCIASITACATAPKEYINPDIDSCLKYSNNQVADKDGIGIAFNLPSDTMPIINNYGIWNSNNRSDMVWVDNDRIAFVHPQVRDKGQEIDFLNIISGAVYPCEDEIQREEVMEVLATHSIAWTRVTDRDKTGVDQALDTLNSLVLCSDYNEYFNAELKSDDENQMKLLVKVQEMKGRRVSSPFGFSYCDHFPGAVNYGIKESKTSDTFYKIDKGPKIWAELTPDGRYLFTDVGILDMHTHHFLTEKPLIQQKESLPPVVLSHAISPSFDKVAILFGYPDHYFLDVVSFQMPN